MNIFFFACSTFCRFSWLETFLVRICSTSFFRFPSFVLCSLENISIYFSSPPPCKHTGELTWPQGGRENRHSAVSDCFLAPWWCSPVQQPLGHSPSGAHSACSLGSPGLEVPPRDSASLHFLCCHCSFFLSLGVSDTFIFRFFRMTSPMLYGFYLFVFPGKTLALHIFHDAGGTCYIPSVPPNNQAQW